jgi:hypothetical protein
MPTMVREKRRTVSGRTFSPILAFTAQENEKLRKKLELKPRLTKREIQAYRKKESDQKAGFVQVVSGGRTESKRRKF